MNESGLIMCLIKSVGWMPFVKSIKKRISIPGGLTEAELGTIMWVGALIIK